MIRVGLINGKSAPAEGSVDSQSLDKTQNKLKLKKKSLHLTFILYIFTSNSTPIFTLHIGSLLRGIEYIFFDNGGDYF